MTGFGRIVSETFFGQLTVEIQSVNRKYLEVFVSIPKEFSRFELDLRKMIADRITRGQISVRISIVPNANLIEQSLPDIHLLKSAFKGWLKIATELGADPKAIDLPFLMQHLPAQQKMDSNKEKELHVLKKSVDEALEELIKMKVKEGQILSKDFHARLNHLEKMIASIESLAPDATLKMRERLKEKMREAFEDSSTLDERLLKEVAIFAERVDITEEITRFRSHLVQFRELLEKGAVGRKMDFLIQEMGREINTIGSKSMEAKISHIVVDVKSEMEKMREQGQNIE